MEDEEYRSPWLDWGEPVNTIGNDITTNSNINIGDKRDSYYPNFQSVHDQIKSGEYNHKTQNLKSNVEETLNQYSTLIDCINGWEGSASMSATKSIQSIKGRLSIIMNDITESLIPACKASDKLNEILEELEKEDEKLEALIKERDRLELIYNEAKSCYDSEPSTKSESYTDPDTQETKTRQVDNPKKEEYRIAMVTAKNNWDNAIRAVETQQSIEEEKCIEVQDLIALIKKLQSQIKVMNSYVNPNGTNYNKLNSEEEMTKNYDSIISDIDANIDPKQYKKGDIIVHDDGFGNLYKVTDVDDYKKGDIIEYDDDQGDYHIVDVPIEPGEIILFDDGHGYTYNAHNNSTNQGQNNKGDTYSLYDSNNFREDVNFNDDNNFKLKPGEIVGFDDAHGYNFKVADSTEPGETVLFDDAHGYTYNVHDNSTNQVQNNKGDTGSLNDSNNFRETVNFNDDNNFKLKPGEIVGFDDAHGYNFKVGETTEPGETVLSDDAHGYTYTVQDDNTAPNYNDVIDVNPQEWYKS